MAITDETILKLKQHIDDLKTLGIKIGKFELEEGQKIEDFHITIDEAIKTSIEIRLLDLDRQICDENTEISKDKLKALRVLGELHKSLRGERTVIRKGAEDGIGEIPDSALDKLKKSIKIEKID